MLNATVLGQGPDLVMLHGWSMHSAVWQPLTEELSQQFKLHLVDLPGHGKSEWKQDALEMETIIELLARQLPETAIWLGWSLGGLISLAMAARYPQRVKKLILLAASPKFVQAEDWPYAVDKDVFIQFSDRLDINQADTLHRFLLLQARGAKHSRDTIRTLSYQLGIESPPVVEALKTGLELLIGQDLRKDLAALTCPVQLLLGDKDTLIPEAILPMAQQLQPKLQTVVFKGAGHAPFISNAEQCRQAIEQFINE